MIFATSLKWWIINERIAIKDLLNESYSSSRVSLTDNTVDRRSDSLWNREELINGGDDLITCFNTPHRISGDGEESRSFVREPVEIIVAICDFKRDESGDVR